VQRVDLVGLDAVLGDRFGHGGGVDLAFFGQRTQCATTM
jgi:hypothetical protein